MRVYLHIGAHKTGTTAIQTAFVTDRDRLSRAGVLYPDAGRPNRWDIAYGHHSLAWALTRPSTTPDCWPQLRAELESTAHEVAVISSECFDMVTENEDLARIRANLEPHEVHVVAYLRRQDEYLHGSYCTNVLFYNERRPISEYARRPPIELDYRVLLEPWERAFGREALIVRPYERSQLADHDIVSDFASQLGISRPNGAAAAISDRVNRSYPRNAVESARRLVTAGIDRNRLDGLRELCALVYDDRPTDADSLAPSERRALLDAYAESNAFVGRRYLGRDDGLLFADLGVGEQESWRQRYGAPLADLSISIRDLRDAFRARLDEQTARG